MKNDNVAAYDMMFSEGCASLHMNRENSVPRIWQANGLDLSGHTFPQHPPCTLIFLLKNCTNSAS